MVVQLIWFVFFSKGAKEIPNVLPERVWRLLRDVSQSAGGGGADRLLPEGGKIRPTGTFEATRYIMYICPFLWHYIIFYLLQAMIWLYLVLGPLSVNCHLIPNEMFIYVIFLMYYMPVGPFSKCRNLIGSKQVNFFLKRTNKFGDKIYLKLHLATGSPAIKLDQNATNGVVQVLDEVMYPPPTSFWYLMDSNFSIFKELVEFAEIEGELTGEYISELTICIETFNYIFDFSRNTHSWHYCHLIEKHLDNFAIKI